MELEITQNNIHCNRPDVDHEYSTSYDIDLVWPSAHSAFNFTKNVMSTFMANSS